MLMLFWCHTLVLPEEILCWFWILKRVRSRQCKNVLAHRENVYLFQACQVLYITDVLALTYLSLYWFNNFFESYKKVHFQWWGTLTLGMIQIPKHVWVALIESLKVWLIDYSSYYIQGNRNGNQFLWKIVCFFLNIMALLCILHIRVMCLKNP